MKSRFRSSLVILLSVSAALRAETEQSLDVPAQIAELRADDYFARERATELLSEAGEAAIAPLVEAINAGELETTARAITILGRLANSSDEATSAAAEKALDALAESADPRISGRVKTALRERQEFRREAAAEKLQALGANLNFQEGRLQTVILQAPAWRGTTEDWQLLRWFPEVYSLICREVEVDDATFKFLSPEMKMQQLSLHDVPITEVELAHLKRLPEFRVLQIMNGGVNDATMELIGQLEQLQILYLVGGEVTDAGMQHISNLKYLRNLRLESLNLTDESLTAILQLSNLDWLDLNRLPELRGEPLKDLNKLPRLRYFIVKYCPIDESAITGMEGCPLLSQVQLYGTKIGIEAADKYAAAHPAVVFDHRAGGLLGVKSLPNLPGCQLQEVMPGMGAALAGIEVNDEITHIDGQFIENFNTLREIIRPKTVGEVVTIQGKRAGKEYTKQVTLSESPE
jgi:hypothetical protein